jgi:hypothetical protein
MGEGAFMGGFPLLVAFAVSWEFDGFVAGDGGNRTGTHWQHRRQYSGA